MRVGAVIQARMSSRRLPGKVLRELAGKPVLQRVVERVSRAKGLDAIAVATSSDPTDDAIAAWCLQHKIQCIRGSLANVAERFCDAAERLGLDAAVRICADSPFVDPLLIAQSVSRMRSVPDAELVTNVVPRTFPAGQSVEVIRTSVLRAALAEFSDEEREHVTLHFYRRVASFRVERIVSPMEVRDVSMAVDEAADVERFERLFVVAARLGEEGGWMELTQQLRSLAGASEPAPNREAACCASA